MARYFTLCMRSGEHSRRYTTSPDVSLLFFLDDDDDPPLTEAELRTVLADPIVQECGYPASDVYWLSYGPDPVRYAVVSSVAPLGMLLVRPRVDVPLLLRTEDGKLHVGATPRHLWTTCETPFKFMDDCATCPSMSKAECADRGGLPWQTLRGLADAARSKKKTDDYAPRDNAHGHAQDLVASLRRRVVQGFTFVSPGVLINVYESLLQPPSSLRLQDVAEQRADLSARAQKGADLTRFRRTQCSRCLLEPKKYDKYDKRCYATYSCAGPVAISKLTPRVMRKLVQTLLVRALDGNTPEWQLWVLARASGKTVWWYPEPDSALKKEIALGTYKKGYRSYTQHDVKCTHTITSWIKSGTQRNTAWRQLSYADCATVFGLPRTKRAAGAAGKRPELELALLYLLTLIWPHEPVRSKGFGIWHYDLAAIQLRSGCVDACFTFPRNRSGHDRNMYATDDTVLKELLRRTIDLSHTEYLPRDEEHPSPRARRSR